MVASFLDEIVKAGTFGTEDEAAILVKVEVGVVGGAALVEADDPDVGFLQLFERAGDVGDACDGDVLAGASAGLGDDAGDGGGAALGEEDAVDARPICRAEESAEVVGVFYTVEREEEAAVEAGFCGEEVFDAEELALADHGDGALVGVGFGDASELCFIGEGTADVVGAAELDEVVEADGAVAGDEDVFEAAAAGADGLLDGVEAVENFHRTSLSCGAGRRAARIKRNGPCCATFSGSQRLVGEVGMAQTWAGSLAGAGRLDAVRVAETQCENLAIARGLKQNDPELLDRLIELYQHRLLRYLLFLTGKREVAEDLFQETWMRVLLRGAQYNGKARFDTWLFTIARNLVIDLSRKRQMASLDEMSEAGEDERPFEVAIDGPSPFEQFATREDRAEVAEVLLRLEPNNREVLVLRFHEEMSLEEIAGVTQAPLSTVKSRLYRGLAALKPQVEQLRKSHASGSVG